MKRLLIAVLVLGCSKQQSPPPSPTPPTPPAAKTEPVPAPPPPPAPASKFDGIDLPAGTKRAEAEKRIATALGTESTYSPYGNNLRGGTVTYTDGAFVLEVVYKAGGPAPWVAKPDGTVQHYPPEDESVISFTITRK